MYRDEKQALKARREALKRETSEVDAQLKAIDDLNRWKPIAPRWQSVCAIGACLMILISFAGMWLSFAEMRLIDKMVSHQAELAPDQDASYAEEYGVISPEPETAPMWEDVISTPWGESVEPRYCEFDDECPSDSICAAGGLCAFNYMALAVYDAADNNCATANDNGLDIIFVLDTSGSMSSYLEDVKRTISAYAKDATAASYALMTTYTDNSREVPFLTSDRETFISFVTQSSINPSTDEEYIPLRMEKAANLGHNLVVAFTDEPPTVPADYSNDRFNALNGLCALRYGNPYFAVFTTPQNVAAWREFGTCFDVSGDL